MSIVRGHGDLSRRSHPKRAGQYLLRGTATAQILRLLLTCGRFKQEFENPAVQYRGYLS
ncbi:hypothetical protein QO004_002442 [Rhizobium mesoamericanum]|uniref:hypothetical protein n=1 Tax=Rhizobium mesoamericanum TaxID=1079800 RepID=UPI002787E893|nr:hypothetical protein [Rhizobium mesoamericanum]MDQ0560653.1 hypothetical protein [Rhizobium mesoamericanum]